MVIPVIESLPKDFSVYSYHTADGGTAATPNDSGKSGNTEFTDGSNGAQGKSSSSLDRLLAMHLDNQLACRD